MLTKTSLKQSKAITVKMRYTDLCRIDRLLCADGIYLDSPGLLVKFAAVAIAMNAPDIPLDEAIDHLIKRGLITVEDPAPRTGNFIAAQAELTAQRNQVTPRRGFNEPTSADLAEAEAILATRLATPVQTAADLADLGHRPSVENYNEADVDGPNEEND